MPITPQCMAASKPFVKGFTPWNKGIPRTAEEKFKLSESHKGQKAWNKGMPRDEQTKLKISQKLIGHKDSLETRKKKSEGHKGEKSSNWKGGISSESMRIRGSFEMKLWRSEVYKRDNWTCVIGGKEHGNKLQADHIRPFALYPELRFDISNGRTLCVECHKKTPTYMLRKNITREIIENLLSKVNIYV